MSPVRTLPYDWSEIRSKLQARLPDLLSALRLFNQLDRNCPQGDGRRIYPLNPARNDRKPGSFVIWVTGDGAGAWKDYATNEKGDVFDLVAYVLRLREPIDVYWWSLDFLGLDRKGHSDRPRTKAAIQAEQERRERERIAHELRAAEADEARSADLFKLWLSLPPIEGTPAERYLVEARRNPRERWPSVPGALRWAREVESPPDPETGEIHTWRNCMVSAMTRGKRVVALHRTYLKPDGSGKANRDKAKLMIGPVRGSAIRLSSGPSGLSPSRAAKAGRRDPLAIGEGIETGWTVACARHDYRVWAAGSLSLMGLLDWPDCASAVVLLGENDWKPEAREAFRKVEAHWRAQAKGRPVVVAASRVGSDFNDWAKGTA